MNPILLLCGLSNSLGIEVQTRCKDTFPGLSVLLMDTLEEASGYLTMEPRFDDRDYPAPHFMILHVGKEQFSAEKLSELKRVKEFSKIPIILVVEGVDKSGLKEAFIWLYSSIIQSPVSEDEKIKILVETAGYWSDIVKLPLI